MLQHGPGLIFSSRLGRVRIACGHVYFRLLFPISRILRVGSVKGFTGHILCLLAMAESMIEGLAAEWDAIESLRDDLRKGKALIAEVSEKQVDIKMPSKYSRLLLPMLNRMREAGKKLPGVEALRCEVRVIMQKNKRDPSEEDIQKYAWLLRKNCGFIKMKCRRQEVSNATCLNNR